MSSQSRGAARGPGQDLAALVSHSVEVGLVPALQADGGHGPRLAGHGGGDHQVVREGVGGVEHDHPHTVLGEQSPPALVGKEHPLLGDAVALDVVHVARQFTKLDRK